MKYFAKMNGSAVVSVEVHNDSALLPSGHIDVSGITPRPAPGWTYDGQDFLSPETPVDPYITSRRLWERMTSAEKQALMEYDGAEAWVRDIFLHEMSIYSRFRKDNARLLDYFSKMEQAGIISSGRAQQILE